MKKLLLLLFTISLNLEVTMAQTTGTPNTDEAAIKHIIEAETAAGNAADYKAYKSHWAKVPYASFLIFGEQYVGDALWKQMDIVWANRKPSKANYTRSNWNIRTKGEAAFVTFNQRVENLEDKSGWETAEARYLEKVNGQWKIVSVVVVGKPSK